MVEMKLSFDPMTIEHLGFKMYSHLPNALAELVANAYDADSTLVEVVVDNVLRTVEVRDDGHGMSAEDLADKYLRIGRNRRRDDSGLSESGRRRVAGRKGLGKLALFGIGKRITVRTKRVGSLVWTVVRLDWDDIRHASGEYVPDSSLEPGAIDEHGTMVLVESLVRKTPVDIADLSASLARLFNYVDSELSLMVRELGGTAIRVDRELRYVSIDRESTWNVPIDVNSPSVNAPDPTVNGVIIASVKPLRQEMRGVTVYVKGRLANDPEYYGVPESSYAYSYLTGYVEADYLDDLDDDVIATDRRSISWESEAGSRLREYLQMVLREIGQRRRETRRTSKRERLTEELNVDPRRWVATVMGPESKPIADVLEVLTSPDTEMSDDDRNAVVIGLSEIAPEYADLYWRHVHPSIAEASDDLYKGGNYLFAVLEAIKRYVADVRSLMPGCELAEHNLLQKAFSENGLDIFAPWVNMGFRADTGQNILASQKDLSVGIQLGFRNPIAHEEVVKLEQAGVFTYQDCLDALGVISHLRRRLDNVPTETPPLPD